MEVVVLAWHHAAPFHGKPCSTLALRGGSFCVGRFVGVSLLPSGGVLRCLLVYPLYVGFALWWPRLRVPSWERGLGGGELRTRCSFARVAACRRCLLEVLAGGACWRCLLELPAGAACWSCLLEVLGGAVCCAACWCCSLLLLLLFVAGPLDLIMILLLSCIYPSR